MKDPAQQQDGVLPVEVDMVKRVKTCTTCQWFWGAVPPYGPFPAYDWAEEFPQAIKDGPPASDENTKPIYWCEVEQAGGQCVEPAVLRGCRKAPIMTIGINPNMTAYFAGEKAASWVYPWFSREQTYAYYYRHATVYQESFSLDTLKACIIPGTEIYAEDDGTLKIKRNYSHRWMQFEFNYDGQEEAVYVERAWLPEARLVVFNQGRNGDNEQSSRVNKGDLIAAKIKPAENLATELYANKIDYYERLQPALALFNQYLAEQGYSECELAMGEDISMHDMVGCASPGWGTNYDIPRERVADNCVNQHRYMIDQLFQSRPKLVFIVSNSSLAMFAEGFTKAGGQIDLNFEDRDIFDLLQETCNQRRTLSWTEGGETFSARVITTPHFSYGDNFKPQSRFHLSAWDIFCRQYPADAEILNNEHRVVIREGDSFMSVRVNCHDDIQGKLSHAAWQLLMDYHYEPYALISEALIKEQQTFPLITNKSAVHLDRATGKCAFCVNDKWTFPEGCEYGLV